MGRLFGWDLPPGVSTRDIDRAAGAFDGDEEDDCSAEHADGPDAATPFCDAGEAYCTRKDRHSHCADCGSMEHETCAVPEEEEEEDSPAVVRVGAGFGRDVRAGRYGAGEE